MNANILPHEEFMLDKLTKSFDLEALFWTLPNISDEDFCEKSERLLAGNYFCKKAQS